jgi:heat shock protein HslJ
MGSAKYLLVAMLVAVSACSSNEPQSEQQVGMDAVTYELAGTRWVPVQLGDKPVKVAEDAREAYVMLNASDGSLVGYAGCNRISTSYKQNGAQIGFGDVIATRMLCSDMSTENGLLQALKAATAWRIAGSQLELLGGQQTLARFEARNL